MIWCCEVLDGPWRGNYVCNAKDVSPVPRNEAQLLCYATEHCEIGGQFQLVSPAALQGVPTTPAELREYHQLYVYELCDRIEDACGVQALVKYHGPKQD